jgi:hypothetical protein
MAGLDLAIDHRSSGVARTEPNLVLAFARAKEVATGSEKNPFQFRREAFQ